MTFAAIQKPALAVTLVAVMLGAGCSTSQVADTTGDTVGFVGRTAVHTVAGAGRLVGRGVSAGYSALTDD
jgi:hypothetical protein